MFEIGVYYYYYYYFHDNEISIDMFEEQVLKERYFELNEEEDIIMEDSREQHWGDVSEDGEDNSKINDLRWYFYARQKEELVNIYILVSVPHTKEGNIFGTCVKDDIIEKKYQCEAIGLRGFDYKLLGENQGMVLERYYKGILI